MVYLIVSRFQARPGSPSHGFGQAVDRLGAKSVIPRCAWLLESDKSAQEVYLSLAEHLDLPHDDHLLVAEITTNSIGSYFALGNADFGPTGISGALTAELIGKARRRD